MSTTAAETPTKAVQDPDRLALGELVVSTHDGARVLRWTLGGTTYSRGLTVAGIAAAAAATARWLDGLDGPARVTAAQHAAVRITPGLWELPLVPSHAQLCAAMMRDVVNTAGAVGQLPA